MNAYDIKALTWDNDQAKVERAEKVADVIKKIIGFSPNMTAYEYGCGTGLLSFCLSQYLKYIRMADSSEGMLSVLNEKIKKFGIANMYPANIDLTIQEDNAQAYDLIYTLMTLHHISDVDNLLRVFYKMLNVNGYLCIADLDKEDGSFHGEGFIGHNGFEKKILQENLRLLGFRVKHYEICYEVVKNLSDGKVKRYPLFVMIVQK